MTVLDRKRALRQELRARRDAMDIAVRAQADRRIARQVLGHEAYVRAAVVLTYLSVRSEVDTRTIIDAAWAGGKTVALPVCVPGERRMRWYAVRSLGGLKKGHHGIPEPDSATCAEVDPSACGRSVALVPGLAFDGKGYRLGYGGGYYDVFLAGYHGVSMGLCRKGLVVASLRKLGVIDAHDRPVDLVVCG